MNMTIYPIPLGVGNTYIIKGEGVVMIDGGAPKKAKAFIKTIKKTLIRPEDIKLLILTHGHWDHIGSARDIKEITGAKIAMHKREKDWLEKPLKPLPPGVTLWGKIFAKIMAMFMPLVHIPATNVDISFGDEEFSLAAFGIAGKVISTPGHSPGSVSIVLDTGDAFVGDLAMNAFPMRLSPGLPIFAEDLQKVKDSWNLILGSGVKMIYPAHGSPFSSEIMRNVL
jgi:glyoxylase-like metal-dependent hydrolase (beta-lactamase superfamily II)